MLLNPTVSLRERFAAWPATDQRVLATLGVVELAVTVDELCTALTADRDAVTDSLRHFDHEGFVTRGGADAWPLAHALIAEEAALVLPRDARQAYGAGLSRMLFAQAASAPRLYEAVHLLLDGGQVFEAFDAAERFLQTSHYSYQATSLAVMLAGSRADATFTRHVHHLLMRRRRRAAGAFARVALGRCAVAMLAAS